MDTCIMNTVLSFMHVIFQRACACECIQTRHACAFMDIYSCAQVDKRLERLAKDMKVHMPACMHAAGQRAHTHDLPVLPVPPLHPRPTRVVLPPYSPFRSPQPPPLLLSREWYTRIHTLRTHMHTHSLTTWAQRVASPENKLEHGCLSKIKVLLDDGLPARQVCIVTFCDTSVAMRASWR